MGGQELESSMNRMNDKQTVTQVVTEQVRLKILSGGLPAGSVLRQDAIAADYTVSRIPVREALRQLEAEGLVTFYAHRGAVVSSLTPEDLSELFEMRALIEPELLRQAGPKLTPRDLKQAERFLIASWKITSPERVMPGWDFYATLYAPASKPKTIELVRSLHNQTNRYWIAIADNQNERDASRARRESMLEALRVGDVEGACDLLQLHFNTCAFVAVEALRETSAERGRHRAVGGLKAAV